MVRRTGRTMKIGLLLFALSSHASKSLNIVMVTFMDLFNSMDGEHMNKKNRKGGRSLYNHVESVACLLFTIAIIVATRAIIYLLAFHLPQKMLPPFVFAAFLFSIVPVKGEGDILKVRDNISTLN